MGDEGENISAHELRQSDKAAIARLRRKMRRLKTRLELQRLRGINKSGPQPPKPSGNIRPPPVS